MKIFSTISLILLSVTAFAQYSAATHTQIHFQSHSGGFVTSLPGVPAGQIGSYYIREEFSKADIFLKDSTKVAGVFVRVDARENVIEIQYGNTIKMLPAARIMFMTVNTPTGGSEKFINGELVKRSDNLFKGKLLQVHYEGNVSLLSRIQPTIKKGNTNPNPMTNLGTQQENEIILKTLYLIAGKDTIIDASQSKSKFKDEVINVFGEDVESLVKHTNNKNLGDLTALVTELDNRSKPK